MVLAATELYPKIVRLQDPNDLPDRIEPLVHSISLRMMNSTQIIRHSIGRDQIGRSLKPHRERMQLGKQS